jgi:hypothetical protein
VKQRGGAALDAPLGFRQQWVQPIVDVRRRAVVGMQTDQDRARLGDDLRIARKCACTQERVFYGRPGHVLGAADRDLNDSIRVGKLESPQRGIQRLGGGDVDGRIGVPAIGGRFEHRRVLVRRGERHQSSLPVLALDRIRSSSSCML